MSDLFGSQKLALACLKCGHKTQETVARLQAHPEFSYTCVQCGEVNVLDTREFRAGLRKADQAVDRLKQTLNRIGKRR